MSEGRNTELVSELRACATGKTGENPYQMLDRAADAQESTSRALSEKEGELAEADGEIVSSHCLIAEERQMRFAAEHQRDEALAALKASEERGLALREALLGMEHSCEQLAAIRSLDAYDAICRDSGGVQALLNLDTARRSARSALENGPGGSGHGQ